MSFEIDGVLKDMAAAMLKVAKEEGANIKAYSNTIIENNKKSLSELAVARLKGDLDEEEFNDELKSEKKVVEAELLALSIMKDAAAQKAANAAMDVFKTAVKSALKVAVGIG